MTCVFKATTAPAEITNPVLPAAATAEATPPGALGEQDSICIGPGPCFQPAVAQPVPVPGIAIAAVAPALPNAGAPAACAHPVGDGSVVPQQPVGSAAPMFLHQCEAVLRQLEQLDHGPLNVPPAFPPTQELRDALTPLLPILASLAEGEAVLAPSLLVSVEQLASHPWLNSLLESPAARTLLAAVNQTWPDLKALPAGAAPASGHQAGHAQVPEATAPVKQDTEEPQAETGRATDPFKELVDLHGYTVTEHIPETVDPLPMIAVIGKERAKLEWHAERLAELLREADDLASQIDDLEDRLHQQAGTWKDHELLKQLQERLQSVKEQIRTLSAFVLQTGWLVGQLEKLASLMTGHPPPPGPATHPPGDARALPASAGCA